MALRRRSRREKSSFSALVRKKRKVSLRRKRELVEGRHHLPAMA
jgi:hypothetical protein